MITDGRFRISLIVGAALAVGVVTIGLAVWASKNGPTAGDWMSLIGSAVGAGLAVVGTLYVERWRLRQAVQSDLKLLSDALNTVANSFDGRTIKSNPNYLLTGIDGVEQILINHANLCSSNIQILLDARDAIVFEDFKTLNYIRQMQNTLLQKEANFRYWIEEFPKRSAHDISGDIFISIIDEAVSDLVRLLRESAADISP